MEKNKTAKWLGHEKGHLKQMLMCQWCENKGYKSQLIKVLIAENYSKMSYLFQLHGFNVFGVFFPFLLVLKFKGLMYAEHRELFEIVSLSASHWSKGNIKFYIYNM